MKTKLITTIMIVLFLVSMLSMAFVAPVAATPDSGIVGLWHFDEGIGSTAYDSSGFDNDGTLSGGKFGNALYFDGNDYVEVAHSTSMDVSDSYTFEAWIYLESAGTSGVWVYRGFFRRGNLGVPASEIEIYTQPYVAPYNGKLTVVHNRLGAFCYRYFTPFPLDQWVHLAVTWDGATSKAYYNNIEQSSTGLVMGDSAVSDKPSFIGLGYYAAYMKGLIDEVRLSNIARTPPFNLAVAPTVDINTVALWHFDESIDPTVYDEAGIPDADDGTIYGAKWAGPTWTTGVFDGALAFDGVDDYVMVPDSPSLRTPSTEVTIEAWIYFPSSSPGLQLEIRKWIDANGGWASYVLGKTADNKIYAAVQNKVLGQYPTWMTTTISALGIEDTWAYIAFTWKKGAIGAADGKIFVNGVSVATTFTPQGYSAAFTIGYGAYPLYFARKVDAWPSNYFKGNMDEVRIWNVALTPNQILASYNGGISKVLSESTEMLGDVLTVTIDVVNPNGLSFIVTDTLPGEFGYFNNFKVNGVPTSPTSVVNDVITYSGSAQLATIEFDVKVTKAYDYEVDVINTATVTFAGGSPISDTEMFTIESFAAHFDKWLSSESTTVTQNTAADWDITIEIHNPYSWTLVGAVTDNFGANLLVTIDTGPTTGTATLTLNKAGNQWRLKWDIPFPGLASSDTATLILHVHTDGISTLGPKELNSGATLKFVDPDGTQLSVKTSPITITVVP